MARIECKNGERIPKNIERKWKKRIFLQEKNAKFWMTKTKKIKTNGQK